MALSEQERLRAGERIGGSTESPGCGHHLIRCAVRRRRLVELAERRALTGSIIAGKSSTEASYPCLPIKEAVWARQVQTASVTLSGSGRRCRFQGATSRAAQRMNDTA